MFFLFFDLFAALEQKLSLVAVVFVQGLKIFAFESALTFWVFAFEDNPRLFVGFGPYVHFFDLLFNELDFLGLSSNENILIVFALSIVEQKFMIVCHIFSIFVPVLLIHQVLIKPVEFLAFLNYLIDEHILQLENVYFLDNGYSDVDQHTKQKIVKIIGWNSIQKCSNVGNYFQW